MALLLIRNDSNYKPWQEAITAIDSNIDIYTPEQTFKDEAIDMILSWKAPHGSFSNYPNLKVIGSMGAGVDHIFEDPSLPKDATITRIVDKNLKGDMQEFVLALALNYCKDLTAYSYLQQNHNWKPIPYKRVEDVTIGIMGLGVLGKSVAEKLHQVGFKLTGWANSKKNIEGLKSYAGNEELNDFLSTAELLVCLLPLTPETESILDKNLFEKLPQEAYLINVARGGHLVEKDLLPAIESGNLSGAALDVFNEEPLPEDHPFWGNKKILITPHTASKSDPSSTANQIVENYNRLQEGKALKNTVSQDKKY